MLALVRCLFPSCNQYTSFQAVTNPYEFEIDGRIFLGTSGQTVENLERYMKVPDKLSLLEQTLSWRHIVPTAPDQLGCYPFGDMDPFVLERCPHVYFVANQKEFQSTLLEGNEGQRVRLLLLPSFADHPLFVLVNLKTLNVQPISICSDFMAI